MNFSLNEEQSLIRDSIARFVDDNYSFAQRNEVIALEHGFSTQHWQQFAELGWLSIPFSEAYGGFGGGPVDTMVIMQEFGRGLVAEPYIATVLLFGGLLQAGADDAICSELIPRVIAGELHGGFAYLERQSRYAMADIATTATQVDGQWQLQGEKTVVLNGLAAQQLIVAARTSGDQFDEAGISLFLIDTNATGVSRIGYRLTDGQEAATITFSGTPVSAVLGEIDRGFAVLQPIVQSAMLAVSAQALGAMEAVNAQTLEYCKTREQFDSVIGSFQALQHRLVETFAACENTKSLLYRAVCAADANDEDAQRSLLALKVMAGRSGRLVGGEAIQLHGGMGMTEELAVGSYVKRLMICDMLFGDADYHQQQFMALVSGEAA